MNEQTKEVFISYSTKDTEIAFALLETFESYGLDCWIAPRNIPKGAQWAEEIDKAIQNARVFVVIVSSHSVESRQVPKEIALAVSSCESIFPFRIDDTGLQGTFRYYLSDYQFTDATSDVKQKMIELAEIICSSLGKPIPEKKPVSEKETEKKPVSEEEPEKKPASEEETEKKPAAEEKPEPVSNSSPQVTSQVNSKKPLMVGVIAAAAVIAVIIGIVFSGKGDKNTETANSAVSVVQENNTDEEITTDNTASENNVEESTSADDSAASVSTSSDSAAAESTSSEDIAAESSHEESTSDGSTAQERSAGTFGVWEKIAYEDRGAETNVNTGNLFILADGTPYFSLEKGLSGSSESAVTPDLLLKESSKYDLTVETSFEDTFDGSISDKPDDSTDFSPVRFEPVMVQLDNPVDENPTGLTYESCYPEQFYYVHLTGTFQESPVSKSDVDTWIVYKKAYPLLSKKIYRALAGKWEDSSGNLWEFSVKGGDLNFMMTDPEGNTYEGKDYIHLNANADQPNFFERIRFEFDKFDTDLYAVLSFDGRKLELLDKHWNSFVLTKEE